MGFCPHAPQKGEGFSPQVAKLAEGFCPHDKFERFMLRAFLHRAIVVRAFLRLPFKWFA